MNDSGNSTASAAALADDKNAEPSLVQAVTGWFKNALRPKADSIKDALEEVIEEHTDAAQQGLAPEEKVMLHNVLSFSDLRVSDIMVPRTDIAAVPSDITLDALKSHLLEQRHTRIPVYIETLDKVQGFIHVKDLLPMLSLDRPYDLQAVMRSLLFVPPSMRIIDLLVRMRSSGSHMAVVIDEHGGTDGLITMEDLFEEIVGDIQDEHDNDEDVEDRIIRVSDTTFEVNARIPISKLEKKLGLSLVSEDDEGQFDSLAGLIFAQIGRIPARHEIVSHPSGIRFEIIDADPRRIRRVRILTAPPVQ